MVSQEALEGGVEGGALEDDLREQVMTAVRVEKLGSYVDSVRIGREGTGEWVDRELMGAVLGRLRGELKLKAFRAKCVSLRLPTQGEKLLRGEIEAGQEQLCRVCGQELETQSHVLWGCQGRAVAAARREVVNRLRVMWREGGLSLDGIQEVEALWKLDGEQRPTGSD